MYLEALSELQDRLPSFPNEIAWAVMEEELGCPVSEVYSALSETPVAAASLGQVYKGVLRETGDVVAVKVQRPGIGESIAVDMLLLRRLMAAVDKNLPQVGWLTGWQGLAGWLVGCCGLRQVAYGACSWFLQVATTL